jgi:hypothetical protein
MKRTPMKRHIPLRQSRAAGPDMEREPKPWAAALVAGTLKPLTPGSYGGSTTGPVPKDEAYRDPVLLELARGRPCLLMVPALCLHRTGTTVACHQNEGKGMGTKRPDTMSVWGCAACHVWYDRSGADRRHKRDAFMNAHARQVLAWRLIAMDQAEPERFRKAARRALEHLNATPIGAAP